MIKYVKLMVIALAMASTAVAGSDFKVTKNVVKPECRFDDYELQLDLYGTGGFYKGGNPGWGGGTAINYFFLKYFGLGVEQSLAARNDATEWGTFGNAFLRYPICSWNLAPYVTAGIGKLYGSGDSVGVGTVGGGLEYRMTKNIALFSDARWLYSPQSESHNGAVLTRLGLRCAF